MKSLARMAFTLALVAPAAACGGRMASLEAGTSTITQAAATSTAGASPPPSSSNYEGDFVVPVPEAAPAAADEHGEWLKLVMQGIAVEVPSGTRWRIQVEADPCHDDARYRFILEDRETGDRLRIDIVDHRVTVASDKPERLTGIVDRIRGSFKGMQTPYPQLRRFGPIPTMPSCATDAAGVPTLVPDEMAPPVTPAVTTASQPTLTPIAPPTP